MSVDEWMDGFSICQLISWTTSLTTPSVGLNLLSVNLLSQMMLTTVSSSYRKVSLKGRFLDPVLPDALAKLQSWPPMEVLFFPTSRNCLFVMLKLILLNGNFGIWPVGNVVSQ